MFKSLPVRSIILSSCENTTTPSFVVYRSPSIEMLFYRHFLKAEYELGLFSPDPPLCPNTIGFYNLLYNSKNCYLLEASYGSLNATINIETNRIICKNNIAFSFTII